MNSQGTGPWSGYGVADTSDDAPAAPELTATVIGTDSIRLTWTVPADNGGDITDYNLVKWECHWQRTPGMQTDDLLGAAAGPVNLHVDDNLMPGTNLHLPRPGSERLRP